LVFYAIREFSTFAREGDGFVCPTYDVTIDSRSHFGVGLRPKTEISDVVLVRLETAFVRDDAEDLRKLVVGGSVGQETDKLFIIFIVLDRFEERGEHLSNFLLYETVVFADDLSDFLVFSLERFFFAFLFFRRTGVFVQLQIWRSVGSTESKIGPIEDPDLPRHLTYHSIFEFCFHNVVNPEPLVDHR
jgi:hypothetical protein